MKKERQSSERGQVMVLLVLGIVALLGFTALAIDGSMLYSDRRFAQNAADASSLAGGGSVALDMENSFVTVSNWDCDSAAINQGMSLAADDAITRAADNGFAITEADLTSDLTGQANYVTVECVNNDVAGPRDEQFIDIRVVLQMQTNTSFVHFVYKGAVVQRVEAVTRVLPRRFMAFGNAIVALNNLPCSGNSNGNIFNGLGGGNINVTGGGVFSNGCLNISGNPNITMEDGGITFFYTDDWSDLQNDVTFIGGGTFEDLDDNTYQIQPSDYALPEEPDCSAGPDVHNLTINHKSDADVILNTSTPISGLWCITGDLDMSASDTLWGDQVTLYFINGNLKQTGSATIQLTAVDVNNTEYDGPALKGVAIYSGVDAPPATPGQPSQLCQIDVSGNTNSYLYGTVLAPACNVRAIGSSEVGIVGQIIGWNVEAGGSTGTNVVFNDSQAVTTPTFLALWR